MRPDGRLGHKSEGLVPISAFCINWCLWVEYEFFAPCLTSQDLNLGFKVSSH